MGKAFFKESCQRPSSASRQIPIRPHSHMIPGRRMKQTELISSVRNITVQEAVQWLQNYSGSQEDGKFVQNSIKCTGLYQRIKNSMRAENEKRA